MNGKDAILCCLLLVLVLHADPALAVECGYTSPMMPFCKAWMCEAECWTEAKLLVAKVMEHKCMKGGIKGWCYCRFCR
ncbi:hypothetical protein HU200_063999 [Digitaria exilis]|uniref:Uncharacterized protein n=1 Tax=Digitaria exilis TaxID=1010633 RepID=A0A835A0N5_9POAL|nr:hypothetical protein HU200_063999 [Digitaria exilis]